VFATGGGSMVGSNVAESAREVDWIVVTPTNKNFGHRSNSVNFEYLKEL
jgi:hypothetical protein